MEDSCAGGNWRHLLDRLTSAERLRLSATGLTLPWSIGATLLPGDGVMSPEGLNADFHPRARIPRRDPKGVR